MRRQIKFLFIATATLLTISGCVFAANDPVLTEQQGNSPSIEGDKKEEQIRLLISELGSWDFEKREIAQAKLEGMGKDALPYLETALKDPDIEVRSRAIAILEKFDKRGLVDLDTIWNISNPYYYLDKGLKLSIGGNDDQAKAVKYLSRYVQLAGEANNKDDVLNVLLNVATSLWLKDRHNAAISLAQFVLEKSDNEETKFFAEYRMARIDFETKDRETAIRSNIRSAEHGRKIDSIRVRPFVIRCYNRLVNIYRERGDEKNVEKYLSALRSAYSDWNMESHSAAMDLFLAITRNDSKEAGKAYKRVLENLENAKTVDLEFIGEIILNYGLMLEKSKNSEEAIDVYLKLIEITYPFSPEVYEECMRKVKALDGKRLVQVSNCGFILSLVDNSGRPVSGFQIALVLRPSGSAHAQSSWSLEYFSRCISDKNGKIRLLFPPGKYEMIAYVTGAGNTAKKVERLAVVYNFPEELTVVKGQYTSLPAIRLVPYLKVTTPMAGQSLSASRVEISWDKFPGAAKYEVFLIRLSGSICTPLLLENPTTTETKIVPREENGQALRGGHVYLLRVFAYDNKGEEIGESKQIRFVVESE